MLKPIEIAYLGNALPRFGHERIVIRKINPLANALSTAQLKTKILELRKKSTAELKSIATSQVNKSRNLYDKFSSVDSYNPAVLYTNYMRWSPHEKVIKDAEEALRDGDKETNDTKKREHYISAWNFAQLGEELVLNESKGGETDMSTVLEPLTTPAKEVLNKAEDTGKRIIGTVVLVGIGIIIFQRYRKNER